MSKANDAKLRPHLSALADGALGPIETIALQQRIRQSPRLAAELHELERIKLAVHLAGVCSEAPATLEATLRTQARAHFQAAARRRAWFAWSIPLGTLALAGLALLITLGDPASAPAASQRPAGFDTPILTARDPGPHVLARLVDFHKEGGSPLVLADLSRDGALITVDRVPDSFIPPENRTSSLQQVSYTKCTEREGGSTLAVLRADRVDLPPDVDAALDATGVYVDTVAGVALRLTVSGDKIFVLLTGDGDRRSASPI